MELTRKTVEDRIIYAESLHDGARAAFERVKLLLTTEYDVPQDVKDLGITMLQPSKPQALLAKALSILASRAKETIEVLPLTGVGKEEERCTKLERFARGVMTRSAEGRRMDLYLAWVLWYLTYGKGCLEIRYFPQHQDTRTFPIRAIAPSAESISEVPGDQGIIYYVKHYKRMKLDIEQELEALHGGRKTSWQVPDLSSYEDTQFVEVKEYWDDTYKALFVEDKVVWLNEHPYGFCPIVVAYCEPLPFDDPEWWGQGLLAPIRQALQQQAIMLSKLLAGLELYFWPLVLVQNPDGSALVVQAHPGATSEIPANAKVTVMNPTVNAPLLEEVNAWLNADINLMTGLPEIAFGKEPSPGASGYMVAQILAQILDRYQQKLADLGVAKGQHVQQILALTGRIQSAEFHGGDVTKGEGFTVDVQPEKGERRRALVRVTAEDVKDERRVHVQITPTLPQEMLMKVQMAQRLRQKGPDGRPLLSDKSLREDYLNVESPDEEEERIQDQMMRMLPQVQEFERAEWLDNFFKEHQEGRGLPKLSERQIKELLEGVLKMLFGQMQPGSLSAPPAGVPPPGMPVGPAPPAPAGVPPELGGAGPGGIPPTPEETFMQQMAGTPPIS